MNLPFRSDQFMDVFGQYNEATWPAAIILNVLGLACVGVLLLDKRVAGRRAVLIVLGTLWAWMAVAYHLTFFAAINPAANVFGAFAIVQAAMFVHAAFGDLAVPRRLPKIDRMVGNAIIAFALFVYPLLGYLAGHRYPSIATFGLPCPTTIFTFGVLAWMHAELSWKYAVIPLLWAAVGTSAALQLGMVEDLGLPLAGVALVVLLFARAEKAKRMVKPVTQRVNT